MDNNISTTEEEIRTLQTKWNDKLEQVAKEIGENAKGYKLMHLSEAQKSSKIYNRLTIIGIILGPLAGLMSSLESVLSPEESHIYITIPSILFSFLSGIIVVIIKFGKYDEQSIANKQAAARYTSIETSVRRQLGLYRNDRMPANTYMDWLETKYQELFLCAPLLPTKAYDQYSYTAKKLGLNVPNRYATTIIINQEEGDQIFENKDIHVINEVSNVDDSREEESVPENNMVEMRRGNTASNLPQLNQYSDKMLEYEMRRINK